MKKVKIFLLLLLSVFVNINACGFDPVIRENIKGKIKTIEQTAHPAVEFNGEILYGEVQIGDYYERKIYDENGNMIEQRTPHRMIGGELIYRYVYDEENNIIEMHLLSSDEDYTPLIFYYKYEYNDKGLIAKKTEDNGRAKNEGQLIEEYNRLITTFKYDDNGNLIEEILTQYGGRNSHIYHCYDENDKKIMTVWGEETTEFDEYGNEIKVTREWDATKFHQARTDITTYQYEYDETGNWIKKIKFKDNPKEPDMIVREITYYE